MNDKHSFALFGGVVITIPEGVVEHFAPAKSFSVETAETEELLTGEIRHPQVALLQPARGGKSFRFCFSTSKVRRGKVFFVPGYLRPGDKIRILWVEDNCACAVRYNEEY